MPNLLVEYMKRHNALSIPLCHNGVCFFESNKQPTLIALTSLPCRTFSTCLDCDKPENHYNVVVETFSRGFAGSFYQNIHKHVNPNLNLIPLVNKVAKDKNWGTLTPFFAKTTRDLEIWLWKFIAQDKKESDDAIIEAMAWNAFKQPRTYAAYYIANEAFLLNRKYLLLDA